MEPIAPTPLSEKERRKLRKWALDFACSHCSTLGFNGVDPAKLDPIKLAALLEDYMINGEYPRGTRKV
jgi:hypothetical protein